jgi:hypothetical protein
MNHANIMGLGMHGSAIAMVVLVFLTASSITIVQPVKASVESVVTSCSIFVDNIVEGQPINVTVQIYPAPPAGETFNLFVWISSPLQGTVGNYPWGTGPWDKSFSSDTNGKATVTFDIHTFSGYWNAGLVFMGQYFANNTIYYQPIQSQTGFSISSAQTPSPSPSHLPSPSPTISPSPSPTASSSPSPSPTPLPNQDPSLTIAVTAVVIAVIVVGVGLFVYFKKRKH